MIKSFILALILFPVAGTAQDISKNTIKWNATRFTDLNSKTETSNGSQFITYGKKKIQWIQDDGKFVVDWNITKTSGTWPDVNQDGSITFSYADDKVKGEVTIKKENIGWSINLTMHGGPSDFNLMYVISSIENLN
jgi:hypothetical protein